MDAQHRRRSVVVGRLPGRLTDRIEDMLTWLLVLLGLVIVIGAALVAVDVHAGVTSRAATERAIHTQAVAVLLEDAALPGGDFATSFIAVLAEAQWTAADGVVQHGPVSADVGATAGTQVPIWLDERGGPARKPAEPADAMLAGVLAAVSVLMLGVLLLALAWAGALRLIAAGNARYWAREWARVEPVWCRCEGTPE